jgi:hypothetical protein
MHLFKQSFKAEIPPDRLDNFEDALAVATLELIERYCTDEQPRDDESCLDVGYKNERYALVLPGEIPSRAQNQFAENISAHYGRSQVEHSPDGMVYITAIEDGRPVRTWLVSPEGTSRGSVLRAIVDA